MGVIKIDYDKAMREASRLRRAAEECDTSVSKAKSMIQQRQNYWKGKSATQFDSEIQQWITKQKNVAREIRNLAEAIDRTAREFMEAEERIKASIKGGESAFGGGGSTGGR